MPHMDRAAHIRGKARRVSIDASRRRGTAPPLPRHPGRPDGPGLPGAILATPALAACPSGAPARTTTGLGLPLGTWIRAALRRILATRPATWSEQLAVPRNRAGLPPSAGRPA